MNYRLLAYYDSFIYERNKVIEYMEDYLSSLKMVFDIESKPFPLTLEREVVLPITREEMSGSQSNPNYLMVRVPTGEGVKTTPYYYFINHFETLSNGGCRCSLELDVLQTVFGDAKNFVTKVAETPFIFRQHKDRFYPKPSEGNYLVRKIDEVSEGITPLKYLYKSTPVAQKDTKLDSAEFCLAFMTANYFEDENKNYTSGLIGVLKTYNDAKIKVRKSDGSSEDLGFIGDDKTSTSFADPFPWDSKIVSKVIRLPYCPSQAKKNADGTYCFVSFEAGTDGTNWYNSVDDLYNYKVYNADGNFANVSKKLRGIHTPCTFERVPTTPSAKPLPRFVNKDLFDIFDFNKQLLVLNPTISRTGVRNVTDSKMYHSDFYNLEYRFDESYIQFDLEKMRLGNEPIKEDLPEFHINYYVSNNLNSTIMFEFEFVEGQGDYRFSNPYERFLICSYSGEIATYSDSYIEYLRNGYNYDLKSKEQASRQNIVNLVLGVGKGVAGVAVGAIAGGTGIGAVGGTALAFNAASDIYNSIESIESNERNFQKKLTDGAYRGVSVSGNVDSDFTKMYSPKLMENIYICNQNILNDLSELFFKYGYACNRYERFDPTSRIWRNFISGRFKWKDLPSYVSVEMREKIDNLLAEGVTFYHPNLINMKMAWDFYGQYENWETSLF